MTMGLTRFSNCVRFNYLYKKKRSLPNEKYMCTSKTKKMSFADFLSH